MKVNPLQRDIRNLQACLKHVFTGKVGWGSHPPHLNFGLALRFFWLKKTISGRCEWGLKFEQGLPVKVISLWTSDSSKLSSKHLHLLSFCVLELS